MSEGRILDQGPHSVLISRNGDYASLIQTFLREKEREESIEDSGTDTTLELKDDTPYIDQG